MLRMARFSEGQEKTADTDTVDEPAVTVDREEGGPDEASELVPAVLRFVRGV